MQKMIQIALDWHRTFLCIHNLCIICADLNSCKYLIIHQMKPAFIGKLISYFYEREVFDFLAEEKKDHNNEQNNER